MQEALAYLLGVLGEPGSVMSEVQWRSDWFWAAFAICLRSSFSQVRRSAGSSTAGLQGAVCKQLRDPAQAG